MQLHLEIADGQRGFEPGSQLRGTAWWSSESAARDFEVRVVWQTSGVGTRDKGLGARERLRHLRPEERRDFVLGLPWEPYSFSGTLLSVEWLVQFGDPGSDVWVTKPIVLAPDGREVRLPEAIEDDDE